MRRKLLLYNTMAPNERFTWAVTTMNIQPADNILEIGCGHGIAVSMIAPMLTTGSITAIDRSAAMIAKAVARNAGNNAVLLTGPFAGITLPRSRYNKIFAFNVNIFLKPTGEEMEKIRQLLAPRGTLYVFYQSLPGVKTSAMKAFAAPMSRHLEQAGFRVRDMLFLSATSSSCVGIICTP